MTDIIHLLPDAVANQIAAGEVIQRPASIIKELVENAIDAGATEIKILVKDAGKSLVQVIDNGCGMSETDARMAFERHATSKISSATDLFSIRTMGFRGEALASVAAVAEVELKTRQIGTELGTYLHISASKLKKQELVNCPEGSNFIIKNVFFNIPARRKFLKSNATELRQVIYEFQKVSLANPEIAFYLIHNSSEIYHLPPENSIKRIVQIFGSSMNKSLISINVKTGIIEISGFVGRPEFAKKKTGEQFLFVNQRFMRHPYFQNAILKAYENILPADYTPSYFIYFESDPENIDINIHPTKTEIKFEDERAIWQILNATIKQSLGKFNVSPSLDFNKEGVIDIPVYSDKKEVRPPEIKVDYDYNPFESDTGRKAQPGKEFEKNWKTMYEGLKREVNQKSESHAPFSDMDEKMTEPTRNFFQLKNKYILTPVKSGLMIIDQKRAHEKILYENFLQSLKNNFGLAQQSLFPMTIELDAANHAIFQEIIEDVCKLGFDIRDFGKNSYVINGIPSDSLLNNPVEIIENLIEEYKQSKQKPDLSVKEKISISLSKASAISYGKRLSFEEMREIVDKLFACESPVYSPDGKVIISIMPLEELEKRF
ncbi:DNA mismatch repair endonuclease MutL [Bacteroidota bacterium]